MTRTHAFAIFIPVVLVIYGSVNAYIFIRGLQAVPQTSALRPWFVAAFWVLALAYVAARILERFAPPWATDGFIWVGSFWLGAMAYFFIILPQNIRFTATATVPLMMNIPLAFAITRLHGATLPE